MSKNKPSIDNAYLLSDIFGHQCYIDADEFVVDADGTHHYEAWRYADTNELCEDAAKRACPCCNLIVTEDGHDPCIANLEGVSNACCGHGQSFGDPYVVLGPEQVLRDDDAIEYFKSIGKYKV